MDLLARLEEEITALRGSGALAAAFRTWKEQVEGLRSFRDAENLIAFLRDSKAGPRGRKDAALAALCVEASSGDQRAAPLLLWLLLPGLLRVRSGLDARDALGAQDLDAELVTGVWEAATKVRPETREVAARLVNHARWHALAAIRQAIDWARRFEPLGAEVADIPEPKVEPGELLDFLTEAVREGVISSTEVQLVLASRQTIREVGARLGITLCGAQNRRGRARKRFLTWVRVLPDLSPVPRVATSPKSSRKDSGTPRQRSALSAPFVGVPAPRGRASGWHGAHG
jgi:hypothetical protein